MNFDELNKMVSEAAGVNICPICGCPFKKYNLQQATCGDKECKRLYKNNYLKEWRKKRVKEDPDGFREYRRKHRHKKGKSVKAIDNDLAELQEYWSGVEEKDRRISGDDYGKKQAEKTLAQVPKINVDIGKECTKK